MTIRLKNEAGLPCAYKPCLRTPRSPEMTFIVRARYRVEPGAPLSLVRTDDVSEELLEKARKVDEQAAADLEAMCITLGQGSITGPRFEETDERQEGEVAYPDDFADFKLKADVLLRGTCHPKSQHDTECDVSFQVGEWNKTLKVIGHRVWVDRTAGGKHTDPKPIGAIAVDYAHAHGGPGFENNPIGKGHVEKLTSEAEDLYQPPRSERSQVMPSQQLPNVVFEDGKAVRDGLAASFSPLNPAWPFRKNKLGEQYGAEWLKSRAPYFAEDFDGTYFNAAPPDQQLDGFLRGDEDVTFTNLHPQKRKLTVRLPELRIRVFVRDRTESCREITMRLDTLFADLDDDSLYLTWRGITPVQEEDLTDVEFGLVVSESLTEPARPAAEYVARLEAFAKDPVGLEDAFPEGFMAFAERAEALEDASDEELEAMLENDEGNSPPVALVKNLLGPMAPDGLDAADDGWKTAAAVEEADEAAMKAQVTAGLKQTMGSGDEAEHTDEDQEQAPEEIPAVGMRLPVREGEQVVFPIGNIIRAQEKRLLEAKKKLPEDAGPDAVGRIDAVLARLRSDPQVREIDPHYKPYSENDPPPDEPGPGADLLGRDLSGRDLSGMDLSNADLQCAILSRTNLRGANLSGAKLGGARLNRVDLSGADLSGVDLTSTSFDRVNAKGADLSMTRLDMFRASKSDFSGASLVKAEGLLGGFTRCTFAGADLGEMEVLLASFDACKLDGARFTAAKLEHVRFDECEGRALVLEEADLSGTSFNNCTLPEAVASGAKGNGPVWLRSTLRGANFTKVDLKASHFYWVQAQEADFSQANLPDARFDRAVLEKASFDGANLFNADLRKAVLTKASFRKASLFDAKLTETAGVDVDFEGANLTNANRQRSTITTRGGV